MRTARPREKEPVSVLIPDRLREFLREVDELIEAGDEAAVLPSDDLLQCAHTCGGLDEDDGSYYFTYFPGGHRTTWRLRLTRYDIWAAARGLKKTLFLWSCTDEACQSLTYIHDALCFYCDYEDDDPDRIPAGTFQSREEWARAYFTLNPGRDPLLMIGAFNGQPGLADRLGCFSLKEADRRAAEVAGEGRPGLP